MKNVTSELSEYLNTQKHIISCDLYELQLANGNSYYYTDADIDIIYNGKIYLHNKLLIKRQQTKINECVVVDTMSITINTNRNDTIESKSVMLAAHDGILDRAKLSLKRGFFNATKLIGAIELFGGNVEIKKCGGIGLELTVKAETQGLAQEFPIRKYYPQGTYSTTNGSITASGTNDERCIITPFVPLKEVLL